MRIALLAPPYLPIPPNGYGGVERIVYFLTEGLVKKGHEVTLFASGDSKTKARLFSTFEKSIGNSGEIKNKPIFPLLQYIDCFSRAEEFDLIHNHAEHLAMFLADFVKTPVVHTMHSTLFEGEALEEKRMVLRRFKNHNFVSISEKQKEGMPDLNWIDTVYNGIDIAEYPFIPEVGNYLLWVGRITRKKGPVEAIQVAKKLGMNLKIAGVIDPIDEEFYKKEVKPFIDGKQIEFIGELNEHTKKEVYGRTICTLYPISWHEPFGLVMVESLATGTPVVAYNMGSVPEIVLDGVTGFIVEPEVRFLSHLGNLGHLRIKKRGVDGLVEAVKRIVDVSREDYNKMQITCRKKVEEKFTIGRMVEGYERVYQRILTRSLR